MLKIAVTGNMGSGKTSVCKVFEILGIPVFYADKEAKKLYSEPSILKAITDKFGSKVLTPDNKLNTKALASIIFNDKAALQYVNSLIHPKVFEQFEKWVASHKEVPYCVQEAALVFESGNHQRFQKIIVVHAPEKVLLERVVKRDGISLEQAQSRLSNQLPQSEKIDQADFSILNDNSRLIVPQIIKIHEGLKG